MKLNLPLRSMYKYYGLSLLLLLSFIGAYAQSKTVKGKVVNTDQIPLSGATVSASGNKSMATRTDVKGEFTLSVPDTSVTLTVSYVGYTSQVVPIGTGGTVSVILTPSEAALKDVVVTALGFEAKKEKLGYATSKIEGSQAANSGEATLVDALGGKASGVRISRSSGSDPGAASQILIRGQSTITRSTDPLIVLDGMPINSDSRGQGAGGTAGGSRLNDINPDDIASIQVLKGASAAALWGTRAAGGVLMITTKKGTNTNTQVNFVSRYSIDKVNARYPMQQAYGQGLNGEWQENAPRSWGDKIKDRPGGSDVFDESKGYFLADNNGKTYYPITSKRDRSTYVDQNWDQVFGTGHYWDNNLSISGADTKSNYYFSVGNLNQQGVIRGSSSYDRTTLRLNASRKITSWLNISNRASFTHTTSDRIQRGVNTAGFMIALLRTPPDFDDAGYIGSYYSAPDAPAIIDRQRSYRNSIGSKANPGFNNAQWDIYKLYNKDKVNRFINSAELTAHPLEWLNLTARAGLDYTTQQGRNFWPANTATATGGSYYRNEFQETILNLDLIARAEKKFSDKIAGNILFGFNYFSDYSTIYNGSALNLIIADGPQSLNNFAASTIGISDNYTRSRTNAGYTSAGFSIDDQLFINGTLRAEAASTFGQQSNSRFFYPSADIAWQFTRLNIFSNNSWLSFGKLRAAYGMVGVQPDPYQTANLFIDPTWNDQLLSSITAGLYGNGTYVQSSNKGNPALRPEKKQEFELGTDLRFWNNRLSTSFTYYQNKTVDALLSIPQPASTGYRSTYANAGEIQNKGFEADLSFQAVQQRDFELNVDINWSKNKNKVISLSGTNSFSLDGDGVAGASSAVVGYPLGELYGVGWQRDETGKLTLDEYGFPLADNVSKPLGDPNPDWRGGLGLTVKYKNFQLTALLEHSQGGVIMDATEAVMLDYGTSASTGYERMAPQDLRTSKGTIITKGSSFRGNIRDFGAGPVALDQNWYTGLGGWFGNVYEQFIKDNTWTRLRTVSLSYSIVAPRLKEHIGISSLIIELSGRNIWVDSNIKGIDPDTNLNGSSSARGVTYFDNPGTRSYLATLKINF